MRDLNFELKQLCQRNRDGSFSTQYARERILTMIANQLHEMSDRNRFTVDGASPMWPMNL